MNSNDYEWQPDSAELEHLSVFGTDQQAIVAIGNKDKIEPWQIGKAAGFSGGTTTDEAKRHSNYSSAVSKATRKNRQLLPHIVALQCELNRFREDGGEPQSVSWQDKLARCEWLIRHGTPSESLRAIEMHNKMKGLGDSIPSAEDIVSRFVAQVGLASAVEGIKLLGAGHLLVVLVPKLNQADIEAEELHSPDGANAEVEAIKQRVGKLEAQA